jgi:DNA-binding MarR family transcriptional regulator
VRCEPRRHLDLKYLDTEEDALRDPSCQDARRRDDGLLASDGVDRIVEQWAGERPDLDTTTMAVLGRTFRIARLSGDATEQIYRRSDISRPEFDVLATLGRSGAPYELSPEALASSTMPSSGGTTARLDRLERAALVTRTPDPDDRRGALVGLTDRGLAPVDAALDAGLARQQPPARPHPDEGTPDYRRRRSSDSTTTVDPS